MMKPKAWQAAVAVLMLLVIAAGCGRPEDKKAKFYSRGRALYEKADYVRAGLEFKNALQIDPKYADAYFMLGQVALKQGDPRGAYSNLSKAVTLDPGNVQARLLLGRILLAG